MGYIAERRKFIVNRDFVGVAELALHHFFSRNS